MKPFGALPACAIILQERMQPSTERVSSLPGDGRPPAAQNVFLDLARGGLRQLGDKGESLRHFEVSEVVAGELPELSLGRGGSVLLEEKERNSENSVCENQQDSFEPVGLRIPDHGGRY